MGNVCCPTPSPCASGEERTVLLNHNSKTTGPTAVVDVEGDFQSSPEADEKIRKLPDEVSRQAGDAEPCNTQENGHLQKEYVQKTAPSPKEEADLEQNSDTGAHDEKMKDELLISTLNSPQKGFAAADWEVVVETHVTPVDETPAPVQHKIPDGVPDGVPEGAEPARTEKPSHTTGDAAQKTNGHESSGPEAHVDAAAAVEPSAEIPQCPDVSPVPDAGYPVTSTSAASPQIHTESPSCALNENSGTPSVCNEARPEDIQSHDIADPCSGPEATGLDHSVVEQNYANSVREPLITPPLESGDSSSAPREEKPDVKFATVDLKEAASSENAVQDTVTIPGLEVQDRIPDPKGEGDKELQAEEEEEVKNAPTKTVEDADIQEEEEEEEEGGPVAQKEDSTQAGLTDSEEDLYRGADELPASPVNETTHLLCPQPEDRCSLATAVDILSYSEREWKGNTAKSALIRKGYKAMSQRFGRLRRVRGDNYCALRATLFQMLCHSTQVPAWLQQEDVTMLPEDLEAQEGLVSQWLFPGECRQGNGTTDATQQLKGYMELLQKKWRAAVDCSSAAERQQLCEHLFRGGEEELGLLEALKLLMLGRAVELHGRMQGGGDVPLFCWLLYARDSSGCPRSFLSNHLRHVGLSAGLEQVEMFLLGYALQCTIQVYRLYMAETEEFVTYYPDDHKDDWPSVSLVTEDDRHYNVPVVREETSS